MPDRLGITHSNIREFRRYSLPSALRSALLGATTTLAVLLVAGGAAILWLNAEINRLDERKDRLQTEQIRLEHERAALLDAIARNKDEFTNAGRQLAGVNNRVGALDAMTGPRDAPRSDGDLQARLDTARQTLREKVFMLHQIPSGYPIPEHGVTSAFGWRTHPVTRARAFHNGIDLRAATGTPVHATAHGVVEWAAHHETSGLGKLIILRHSFGFRTFFAHLDSVAVEPGDFISRGDVIGRVGSTGLSSGPHLHYEVRYIHRKFDPVPFLEWNLKNYDALFTAEKGVQWDALASAVKRQLRGEQGLQLSLRAPPGTEAD